ncbi:MAG: iron chelate uptake ABC transporter family permease subunit, partial [Chloroflexi bacterium]|nr:iron chelate uptake ABC transporter family permease subunit [Chloroflexota bacterium]
MLRSGPRFICKRKVSRYSPCRYEGGRDFLLHTAKSGAPNLRSGEERPSIDRLLVRLYLGWLRRNPVLSGSPVLLRLAGGAIPLFAVGIILVIIAAALGPYTIPFSHTADILLAQIGIGQAAAPDTEQAIVASIRLPRIALALTVGAALGVAGAVMQGLFRNPMAD